MKFQDIFLTSYLLNLCLRERTIKEGIQRVDYKLNEEENIALLTGANSGGKTTLLETISQIAILGQMGLPVPAKSAKIKLLDEIWVWSLGGELGSHMPQGTAKRINKYK